MLNPGVLLTLAFKNMLCDDPRKMGDPVSPAPALYTKTKKLHKGLFSEFRWIYLDLFCKFRLKNRI